VTVAAPLRSPVTGRIRPARAGLLIAVVATVALLDQASKAWAWRHLGLVHINSGSGLLFGDRAGNVYRDDRLGTVVDIAGVALIGTLATLLLRLRWPRLPFVGAALILAGWASNLADRLGLHVVTAPGSTRGVVDFLHFQGRLWNLADVTIIAGTGLCTAFVLLTALRRGERRPLASDEWSTASTAPSPVWAAAQARDS